MTEGLRGKDLRVDKIWSRTCPETFLDVPVEMRSVSDCHLRPLIREEAEAPQSIRIAKLKKKSEIHFF